MTNKWSAQSKAELDTCHGDLQRLFNRVLETWDCTVLQGHRSQEEQDENVAKGVSEVRHSKHNTVPSLAVDVAPYPVHWPDDDSLEAVKDYGRFYMFAGFVLGTAKEMGINIRMGADWDGDFDLHDQEFDDLVHFELLAVH